MIYLKNVRESYQASPPTDFRTRSLPICESGIIVIALRHDRDRRAEIDGVRGRGHPSTRHCWLNLDAVTLICDTAALNWHLTLFMHSTPTIYASGGPGALTKWNFQQAYKVSGNPGPISDVDGAIDG